MANALPILLLGAAALLLMSKGGDEEEAVGGLGSDGESRPFFGTHRGWTYNMMPSEDDGLVAWTLTIKDPDGAIFVQDGQTEWSGYDFGETQDIAKSVIDKEFEAGA